MGRGDLTDEQWAVLEPLLPKGTRAGRPSAWPRRQLIDGIRFRARTDVPWRDVPVAYGPWGRIYDLFRRWQRHGTWLRILTLLQSLAAAEGVLTWDLTVDSTVCRAHQHAAGARKQGDLQIEPPGGVSTEPRDHGLGRSRGGFTTKLHLAVEHGQKPMAIVVMAGQRRLASVRARAGEDPHASHQVGPATPPPRPGAEAWPARQGVRLPQERRLPAPTRDPLHHPRQDRPGAHPPEARLPRRPAGRRNPTRPTTASVTRSSAGQPPQETSRCSHATRQARRPLRGDRPRRDHQRVAVTGGLTHRDPRSTPRADRSRRKRRRSRLHARCCLGTSPRPAVSASSSPGLRQPRGLNPAHARPG